MSISFPRNRALRPVLALLLGVAAVLTSTRTLHAQPLPDGAQPAPRLLTVTPSGGKIGTTVEIAVAGADLDEPEKLLFSHPGIKAEPIVPPDPPPPPEGKPPTPKTPVTKFKVTIAPETPVGAYDVRLVNKYGISNPRAFTVGDLNEVMEKEPNNDVPEAQRVELNTTVNGAISTPTDVDYFVFTAKKGQRVWYSLLATSIDSRFRPAIEIYNTKGKLVTSNRNYHKHDALCDITAAEDGDYHVRLFEFTHTQGTAEHFYRLSITTGPWIDAVHPCVVEPGKPTQVTVYGRNLPGGKPDPALSSDESPLERITVTVNPPADASRLTYNAFLPPVASQLDGFEYRIKTDAGWSNPFLLTFAHAPLVIDNDAPKTPDAPQLINVPCEIAGHIEKERDRDWYQFTAKANEVYNIELFSERLSAPAYMYFLLRNADKKTDIVESTDNNDVLNLKFFSRSDDPQVYKFTVPADGKYLLMVTSRTADRVFGPRQFYRVRVTPDQPDFHLVVMGHANNKPDGSVLGQGGVQKFDVFAWRRDGFTGEIALTVEGLPPTVTCIAQSVPTNQRQAALVLTAAADAAPWTGEIKVKGTATVRGQKVTHEARSGTILWPVQPQQNIAPLSRIDHQIMVAVRDKPAFTLTASLDKPAVPQGTPAQITLKVQRNSADLKNPIVVQATPGELPQGFTVNNNQPLNIPSDKNEAVFPLAVPAGIAPGDYTIVVRGTVAIPFSKDPKGTKQPLNFVEYSTPVTLTVLPKSLVTLALPTPTVMAKAGATTELAVKLTRQLGYAGEFKIEVVVPTVVVKEPTAAALTLGAAAAVAARGRPAVRDVTVEPITVAAGKDEAKLAIVIPADAPAGNRADLVVKATAMYNGHPIVHELKFNVSVVK